MFARVGGVVDIQYIRLNDECIVSFRRDTETLQQEDVHPRNILSFPWKVTEEPSDSISCG